LLEHIFDKANADSRDVLSKAEYPRCSKLGFKDIDNNEILNERGEYSKCLNFINALTTNFNIGRLGTKMKKLQ
jgi:hypothetical protein